MDSGAQAPLTLDWRTTECPFFYAEHARKGEDFIYHFFPPNEGDRFCRNFAMLLEDGFKAVLPRDAVVEADFTSKEHSAGILKANEGVDTKEFPRESYFVKVVGWAYRIGSDRMLRGKVFTEIERACRTAQNGGT